MNYLHFIPLIHFLQTNNGRGRGDASTLQSNGSPLRINFIHQTGWYIIEDMHSFQQTESIVSNPHIRRVDVRRDLDEIASLIETCFAETLDEDGQAYVRQIRKSAEDARRLGWVADLAEENNMPVRGFIWEQDGRIIGNLTLIPLRKHGKPVNLVANVSVLPQYRRLGIAKQLTQVALAHVQHKQGGRVWLQVRDDNAAAEMLYRKLGFMERARRTTWHHYAEDPKPKPLTDMQIYPCGMTDWHTVLNFLQNIHPDTVSWNLQVNFQKFKPGLLTRFTGFLPGDTHRSWLLRKDGQLLGTLCWEASRTWADNLWLGCPLENIEVTLQHLLPFILNNMNRSQPQSINFPVCLAEEVFGQYGFKKHYTLIWMELEEPSLNPV
ncbi:MAG: hypothetical protein C0391_06305 [Anaerolinea sp.]|nr:hypothetical protein [Anaerolinea sp.]